MRGRHALSGLEYAPQHKELTLISDDACAHTWRICSDAGGGGERVLWCAIQSLASMPSAAQLKVVVYTGDIGTPPEAILDKVKSRFGLTLPAELDLEFVYVQGRHLLEAKRCVRVRPTPCDARHSIPFVR